MYLNHTNYDNILIELNGCRNAGRGFGASFSIVDYLKLGIKFVGRNNELNGDLYPQYNENYNSMKSTGYEHIKRFGYIVNTEKVFNISLSNTFLYTNSFNTQGEYVKFIYVGHNNGSGGTITYKSDITLVKGYSTHWDVFDNDETVLLTDIDSNDDGSIDLTITPIHSGNKLEGMIYILDSSANIIIK